MRVEYEEVLKPCSDWEAKQAQYSEENGRDSYVYTLARKSTKIIFYVGRGINGRMFNHEKEARRGIRSLKCDTIRQIWAEGDEIIATKECEHLTSWEAEKLERYLIRKVQTEHGSLVNLVYTSNKSPKEKRASSIKMPSLTGPSLKRFRRCVTLSEDHEPSNQELTELVKQLSSHAIDAYCEGVERDNEAIIL